MKRKEKRERVVREKGETKAEKKEGEVVSSHLSAMPPESRQPYYLPPASFIQQKQNGKVSLKALKKYATFLIV
ncbi:unnamed protein product [Acanthoscelides obtectus]|uniref:Uncharacterized protein n=1 Tax=Acanthoscelides obtectus TaxID=200917 RepID=A0A9P0LJV7_ACAOB|nr:unnamed protein product [Acanthoscelides obtectus]CAK1621806.1 hypothetical protein AOBTE_LOCUS1140 [Acanthoscelides obtectus]